MGAPAVAPRRAPARAPAGRSPSRTPAKRSRARSAGSANSSSKRAAARRAPARRAQVRVPARPNHALAGAALIPHAAVRTADAVRDLSDSSLIVRLTAGRGWIAVLCALLGGIVALNVISLSINTTSGRVSQAIEEYERRNSALRAELAETLSAGRVEEAAAALGLAVPAPEAVAYLNAQENDLQRLADALGGDTVLSMDSSSATAPGSSYEDGYSPAPVAPTAPSTGTPAPAPVAPAPAPAPVAPAPSGGGGSSGGVGL